MLSPTYTSVKNANLVDCGKKQHISSQPSPLLKDNFLGEFRTELEKKKVLANLGIATELSLEWQYIKGDIGSNTALMTELDRRGDILNKALIDATTYTVDGITQKVKDVVQRLEVIINLDTSKEEIQNANIASLQTSVANMDTLLTTLGENLNELSLYVQEDVKGHIDEISDKVTQLQSAVNSINSLIKISTAEENALITKGDGLYVLDLQPQINEANSNIQAILDDVNTINTSLEQFVKREELGDGELDFVETSEYSNFVNATTESITGLETSLSSKADSFQVNDRFNKVDLELSKTVKTGEDGHVKTLYVNEISKNNNDENIKITDSFEMTSGIPLDVRFVVNTAADLHKLDPKVCYAGMGVIVADQSSLYILRQPSNGTIDSSYIQNINNWKCPEDLVTQALSREEYETLIFENKINPNVFYYIYEEEITRTQCPVREDFASDLDYEAAVQEWNNSLLKLSNEYLSAAWGVGIEEALRKRATKDEVLILSSNINSLQTLIDSISGGNSETSLNSLAQRIESTELDINYLLGTEGSGEEPSERGKIYEIETSIENLNDKILKEYVSIESITTDSSDTEYIFVKKSEHALSVESLETSIQSLNTELTTGKVTASEVVSESIILNGSNLNIDLGTFKVGDALVAYEEDVPKIEILTELLYKDLVDSNQTEENVYYYTLCEEDGTNEFYVTNELLNSKIQLLSALILLLSSRLLKLEQELPNLNLE